MAGGHAPSPRRGLGGRADPAAAAAPGGGGRIAAGRGPGCHGGVTGVVQGSGRYALLWMLVSFVVTFLVTRVIVHLIKAGRGPFRDAAIGDTHVHHLVYGIFALMGAGTARFLFVLHGWWQVPFAVLFGIGLALTLDEFALWLHLEDVYWTKEGRASVDAAVYAAGIGLILLVGDDPFADTAGQGRTAAAVTIVVTMALSALTLYKGKRYMAVAGVFVPVLALFGALRLAKPGSPWARRFYRERSRRARRMERRARLRLRYPTTRLLTWTKNQLAGTAPAPRDDPPRDP